MHKNIYQRFGYLNRNRLLSNENDEKIRIQKYATQKYSR